MHSRLLAMLACPACRGDLGLRADSQDGDRINAGTLTCIECGRVYPITRGIPRLLPERMRVSERRTTRAFAAQWHRFDGQANIDSISFWSYCQPLLEPQDFSGRKVLEVGCGGGRYLSVVANAGAQHVVGLDLSDSVDDAAARTAHLPNVDVVQGSALALPFKPVFEVAYSVGVLHHLIDPEAGFQAMTDVLAEGGHSLAWVYGREGNGLIIHAFDPVRRHLLSRLPFAFNRRIARVLGAALWLMASKVYPLIEAILPPARKYLPLRSYLAYVRSLDARTAYWIVVDQMIPTLTHYISEPEFRRWFEKAGLADVQVLPRSGNSWRGVGTRRVA